MLLRLPGITLVATLIGISSAAAIAKTALEENDLIGPVRTVTTKTQGSTATETYDLAGNLTEATVYLEHGDILTRYVFTYGEHGNLQEEIASDTNGKLIYRKVFAYARDSSGRETASVAASEDGAFQYAEFSSYDHFGNLSEKLLVDNATTHRSVFDALGRIIYSATFSKGQLFREHKHGYDNRGRLSELTSYTPEGAMTGKVANQHDDAGRRIRATTEKFQTGETGKWVAVYEYDATGNWIKEITWGGTNIPQETGSARSHPAQERIIEYYEIRDGKTP